MGMLDFITKPLGNLLGGVGKAITGTPASTQTQQLPTMTPSQRQALDRLLASLQQPGAGVTPYTAPLAAPQTRTEQLSLTALEQAAQRAVTGGAPTSVEESGAALRDVISRQPRDVTDYFQTSVAAPLEKEFTERVLPAITQRYRGQAGFGTDRMTAERQATEDLGKTLAAELGRTSLEAMQEQERNRITAAMGLAGMDTAGIQNILATQQGGLAAREAAQVPLTAQYQEFLRRQQGRQTNIENILRAIAPQAMENVVTVNPGQEGLLQSAVKGFASRSK